MTTIKHTPGPWLFNGLNTKIGLLDGDRIPSFLCFEISIPGKWIAQVSGFGDYPRKPPGSQQADRAEAEANARLIAAAPELLAAAKAKLANCEGCLDAALRPGERCSDECVSLETAIARAEGADHAE